jgi:thioredoxin 1
VSLIFPDTPVELFDTTLDGALKIHSPLVVDCWELGCWPCQKMETTIDQMAKDFKGEIVFGKLCTDFNPVATGEYGILRTPTLLIFRNGTLIHKHVGNSPREELEQIILATLLMR